jgi:hypothetical protein
MAISNAKAQSSNEVQNPSDPKKKDFGIKSFVIDLTFGISHLDLSIRSAFIYLR